MTGRMTRTGTAGQGEAALFRELLVGLLVALFLLSSIAALRAKSAFTGPDRAFALCMSGEAGGSQPADHDCDSCRTCHAPLLPTIVATDGWPIAARPASPGATQRFARVEPEYLRPWLRGPPIAG